MQSFSGKIISFTKNAIKSTITFDSTSFRFCSPSRFSTRSYDSIRELPFSCKITGIPSVASSYRESRIGLFSGAHLVPRLINRGITTVDGSQNATATTGATEIAPRIKFKRLDKTARHIMQIVDKEAVQEVNTQREIPEIKPGYIIQLKLEVPENKRRVSTVKGIVIARRNAGLNTTIRLRRLVAGVGVENLLPLYSPNVKEIKVLDKKKVRRAKLYYLRDKMNALRK
ncbi:large ribosomal subunit protein bL19cz-like [Rutidosis leptorrhynchoides]|uniref:large ribosomal subunit protein bL19cz-like n=1 Tax=Rutidosis leptorrhynchoides TaxID=125765 RepID=UPI003A99836F